MKVLVSIDIEGVAGVVHPDQSQRGGSDFERTRRLMTAEAAAARGALAGGPDSVVVADAHGDMRNLIVEELDPRVEVISGNFRPLSMIQGVESHGDCVLFVGYHARMGTLRGVMNHTHSGTVLLDVSVNGRVFGEIGLNALVCEELKTPVGLVTGDAACCSEAAELMPSVRTVVTKWGYGRYSARSLHPSEACRQIEDASRAAVSSPCAVHPIDKPPFLVELRFQNSGMADAAEIVPGFNRIDALTIRFETSDAASILRARLAAQRLADASVAAASLTPKGAR